MPTIHKKDCVKYSLTVDVAEIKITSDRMKSAKIDVEMFKTHAHCRQFMDAAMITQRDIIMMKRLATVHRLRSVDVVATRTTSTHRLNAENYVLNVNQLLIR